jgi:hypothetical protein
MVEMSVEPFRFFVSYVGLEVVPKRTNKTNAALGDFRSSSDSYKPVKCRVVLLIACVA